MPHPTDEQEPVFPLSGWDIGIHKVSRDILFRPHFLATMMDSPDKPQQDRTYALSPRIARELAQKLVEIAGQMEIDESPIAEHLKN